MDQQYNRLVKAVSCAAVVFASIMLVIKVYAWWQTGSVSLLAALVDSLVDITASSINFVIIRFSLRPADDNHSFGHGKAESLAALAQSMFVAGSAIFLFLMGMERLTNSVPMQNISMGVSITIISFFSTIILVMFQRYVVKRTKSQAIWADMLHYQTDVMINGAILIALGMTLYGFEHIDAIFALGIAGYILWNAAKMAYEAIQSLLDHTLSREEQQRIMELAQSEQGVLNAHDLRTRRSGNTRFIQLHLALHYNLMLSEAHNIAVAVEQKLLLEFPNADIIIHLDPLLETSDNTVSVKY